MIPVTASAKRWLVIEFLMKSCHGIEGHFDAVAFALAGICVGWHLRWLASALEIWASITDISKWSSVSRVHFWNGILKTIGLDRCFSCGTGCCLGRLTV